MTNDEFIEKITSLETAPFQEVAQFIKARKKHFRKVQSQKPFWTSLLLAKFSKKIMGLPFAIDFLFDYFKQPDTNLRFIQEAAHANPKQLERVIKLSRADEKGTGTVNRRT